MSAPPIPAAGAPPAEAPGAPAPGAPAIAAPPPPPAPPPLAPLQLARLHGADADGARGLPLGAVKNLTLMLRAGIHAFAGTPADGTAALVALIAGATRPRIGQVQLCGGDPFDDPASRRQLGVLPVHPCLPPGRDVAEVLAAAAALRGVDPALLSASLARIGAAALAPRRVASLSRQEARAVELAVALGPDLPVLALYDPLRDIGPIDPAAVRERLWARARDGACVVVATRHADDVIGWCDHLHLLSRGVLCGSDEAAGWPSDGAGTLRAWIEASDAQRAALGQALGDAGYEVAWDAPRAGRACLRLSARDLGAASLALADAIAAHALALYGMAPEAPPLQALVDHTRSARQALLTRIDTAPPPSAGEPSAGEPSAAPPPSAPPPPPPSAGEDAP